MQCDWGHGEEMLAEKSQVGPCWHIDKYFLLKSLTLMPQQWKVQESF